MNVCTWNLLRPLSTGHYEALVMRVRHAENFPSAFGFRSRLSSSAVSELRGRLGQAMVSVRLMQP